MKPKRKQNQQEEKATMCFTTLTTFTVKIWNKFSLTKQLSQWLNQRLESKTFCNPSLSIIFSNKVKLAQLSHKVDTIFFHLKLQREAVKLWINFHSKLNTFLINSCGSVRIKLKKDTTHWKSASKMKLMTIIFTLKIWKSWIKSCLKNKLWTFIMRLRG